MRYKRMLWLMAASVVLLAGCGSVKTNSAHVNQKADKNSDVENGNSQDDTADDDNNSNGNDRSGGKNESGAKGKNGKSGKTGKDKDGQNGGTGTDEESDEQKDEAGNGKDEDGQNSVTETGKDGDEKTVTITAVGDCTFGSTQLHGYDGSFYQYYDNKGDAYFFEGVRDYFENDDLTLINLECVLTNSEERVEKKFNMKGKPEYTGIMTSSSVEACSLGNNHTLDYGEESLKDTQKALDKAKILYGYNDHTAIYTTEQGVRVGMVSVNLLNETEEMESYVKNGIENLREQGADIVVASCHWGIERQYYPTDYQTGTAHKIIDWGADLIIGCHPHVLQGIEYYKGKVICYSMGNFCFGGNSNPSDKDTMIFQQTFTLKDGKLKKKVNARIIPCRLSSTSEYNDYQPTVAKEDKKERIIENMNEYCKPYGNVHFSSTGKLSIKK